MKRAKTAGYGETVVINGAIAPQSPGCPPERCGCGILNGANASDSTSSPFADNRTFYKIASDGGLLSAPVPMTTMEMSPGERCEIIVDLSDGKPAELLTLLRR